MAAIVATDVTVNHSWQLSFAGVNLILRVVSITISSNGGTADDIPASFLGFDTIYWASTIRLVDSGDALHDVPVMVEADGAGIVTVNLENSTDNQRSDAGNSANNGTLRVLVLGTPNT